MSCVNYILIVTADANNKQAIKMFVISKVIRIFLTSFEVKVIGITNAAPRNPADKLINKSESNLGRTKLKLFMYKL